MRSFYWYVDFNLACSPVRELLPGDLCWRPAAFNGYLRIILLDIFAGLVVSNSDIRSLAPIALLQRLHHGPVLLDILDEHSVGIPVAVLLDNFDEHLLGFHLLFCFLPCYLISLLSSLRFASIPPPPSPLFYFLIMGPRC